MLVLVHNVRSLSSLVKGNSFQAPVMEMEIGQYVLINSLNLVTRQHVL